LAFGVSPLVLVVWRTQFFGLRCLPAAEQILNSASSGISLQSMAVACDGKQASNAFGLEL